MSESVTDEAKQHDVAIDPVKHIKCRIPQRLPSAQQKSQLNKPKPSEASTGVGEKKKAKTEAAPVQQRVPRFTGRPRTTELRPKSANRVKDDLNVGRSNVPAPRSARPTVPGDRFQNNNRRASTIPRKVNENTTGKQGKFTRIVVPNNVPQQQVTNSRGRDTHRGHGRMNHGLPDQEVISKQEKIAFRTEELDEFNRASPMSEKDSTLCYSQSDKMLKIQLTWQQNVTEFEKMKHDLTQRQNAILEFYSFMRTTHAKMRALGQKADMPSNDDLRVMNVANLTAEQLLQLCSCVRPDGRVGKAKDKQLPYKSSLTFDMTKLYALPSKLVATCEQTLFKRKEIINWFETLKSEDKGIGMNKLSKKINEFNAENEMLKCSLEQAKGDFLKEMNEIIEFMRKAINETVALQLRTEDLTYTITELNSHNADLRKQMYNAEHLRPNTYKAKVEELEKELKEERCKKIFMRDRLSRAEGQIKIGVERASQLEAALEQSRSQTWSLERKVQQLNEQNTSLQSEFDQELNKLRESIKENTQHLELIAEAREKLQAEKEDLVKRLEELSNNYNESIQTIKHEMNATVAKLIDAEKRNGDLIEEKNKIALKLQGLCSQLVESELRFKDLTKELQDTKHNLEQASLVEKELSSAKRDLDIAVIEIEDYRKKVAEQSATIKEYENNIKESINLEENLKSNLLNKEMYISDLEKRQSLLEKQLQESESKMESYQEQLSSLKNHIAELQKDFGDFENLNELREMVNQQRAKLLEATRQNGELAETIQNKDAELERHLDTIAEQEQLLTQRNGVIKKLTGKDEEHTNIIKLLRNNLEMRNQADMDLNQQITEKNAEVEALLTNVETRKQQISQLEKIILTLEEQLRKVTLHRRKDQEKLTLLEQRVADYESYHMEPRRKELPSNNLDSIIKILEDELGTSFDASLTNKEDDFVIPNRDRRREKLEDFECLNINKNHPMYENDHETLPTKIVMGNFVKKTYISSSDEQYKSEMQDRKKAITNMDSQKWLSTPEPINVYSATVPTIKDSNYPPFRGLLPAGSHLKDNVLSRNIHLLTSNQLRDEKKCKMFKIAGHRL
ncbi:hypothetical protein PYW08_015303 [Mythimna loreyi]|uniref:Uncharacterized protein n=1 Tax=Mythimna loreyi TaxID=667449 RepID=A0ACC2QVF4_9NEOP|nr:hypothetical protein PYW08_015303 [Mythimna loreyi]